MPKLPVTTFIEKYKKDPKEACEWLDTNEIESITWTQIFHLGEIFDEKQHNKSFLDAHRTYQPIEKLVRKSTNQIASLSGSTFEKTFDVSYAKSSELTLWKYLILAQMSDSLLNLLHTKAPEKVISLIESITQVQNLAEVNKPAAIALIKLNPKKLTALVTNRHQLLSLSKKLGADLCLLTDSYTEKFSGFYNKAEEFIELIQKNPTVAGNLMHAQPSMIGKLINDRTSLLALAAAAATSSESDASPLIANNPEKFVGVFETPDQFIELIKTNRILATQVLQMASATVANLFKTSDDFLKLVDTDRVIAEELIKAMPEPVMSLFLADEDKVSKFIALIERDDLALQSYSKSYRVRKGLAGLLMEKVPNRVAALFSNHNDFITLASQYILLAKSLITVAPESIVSLFKKGNSDLLYLMETLGSDAKHLFESEKAKICFTSLFTDAGEFINFANMDSALAESFFQVAKDQLTALFTRADEFTQLALINSNLAILLIDHNDEYIAGLFDDYNSLMDLLDYCPTIGIHLFRTSYKMVSVFETADQFVKFTMDYTNDETPQVSPEELLLAKAPVNIALLFREAEQFIQLLEAKESYANLHYLITADSEKFAGFLENHDQFLLLARKNKRAAEILLNAHPDKMSALFDTEEKKHELKSLSATLGKKLSEIQNKSLTAVTDYAFYLDVFATLMGVGSVALIIVGLIAAHMAMIVTGVTVGIASLLTFGLFGKDGWLQGSPVKSEEVNIENSATLI